MDQILRDFGNTIAGVFSSELVQFALRAIGIYVVVLWLATAFWAYQDMKSRTSNPIMPFLAAAFIVAFTPLLFIFAAILYRIIRPHERVGEAHERMLAEEAMLAEVEQLDHCLGCGRRVDEGWLVCPICRTRLRRACPNCGKLVGIDWVLCAWCGMDVERSVGRPAVAAAAYAAPTPRHLRAQQRQPPPAPAASLAPARAVPAAYAQASYAQIDPAGGVAGWPGAAQPVASAERTAPRSIPASGSADTAPTPAPAPVPASASVADAAPATSRPAPVPAPSPFRSISGDLDIDQVGSLVIEPATSSGASPKSADATRETDPAEAPAPARISGRRSARR